MPYEIINRLARLIFSVSCLLTVVITLNPVHAQNIKIDYEWKRFSRDTQELRVKLSSEYDIELATPLKKGRMGSVSYAPNSSIFEMQGSSSVVVKYSGAVAFVDEPVLLGRYEILFASRKVKYSEKVTNSGQYVLVDTIDYVNRWVLENKSAVIQGYECQQASMVLQNKTFVLAWFSHEIEVPIGPAQYYGLPGAILLAESRDKNGVREVYEAKKIVLNQ